MKTAIADLISAARGQAERLRRQKKYPHTDDDEYQNARRLVQAEAKRWEELADEAEQEYAGYRLFLRPPAD